MHTQHDYELDRAYKATLEASVKEHSTALQKFPKGAMGLTPDSVKKSPQWLRAKKEYDKAFIALRCFNSIFVKKYKKEMAMERKELRNKRQGGAV